MDFLAHLFDSLTPAFWILAGSLFFFWLIQVLYYLVVYKKPCSYERKREKIHSLDIYQPSVSVIIASKNEADNIARNLPPILEQDYPDFEVIVVNMGSTDETDVQLKLLGQKYPNLYHTYIPEEAETYNEKKLALTIGAKAAKNDILLFTEAYCKPSSELWIQEFANEFKKGRDIVLGYCKLHVKKGTFMRKFILYDNLIQNLKFLSLAILRHPFMGINRNLAYKRELFFEEKGFSSVLSIENGEDDLFINNVSRGRKAGVVVSADSMTESDVVDNFQVWRNLKSKYLFTKKYYKGASSFVFGLETFTKYCFYLLLLAAVAYGICFEDLPLLVIASSLFLMRFAVQLFVINRYGKSFGSGRFYISLLFFDIFQPFNNFKFRRKVGRRYSRR